jgi:hypothetical protein
MLIALLAVLGVNLIVVVALLALVISRKRWVGRQSGAFQGAVRVAGGELDGFGSKWKRGYGRWVRDVFVWTKAPFLFRNELVATDSLGEQRPARTEEVKRLGDNPIVIELTSGNATVEVAAKPEDTEALLGPYRKHADAAAAGSEGL